MVLEVGDASEAGPESPTHPGSLGQDHVVGAGPTSCPQTPVHTLGPSIMGSPEKGSNPTRPGGSCELHLELWIKPKCLAFHPPTSQAAESEGKGYVSTQFPKEGHL